MQTIDHEQATAGPARGRTCEECQAPLDADQRYCVRCGSRQRDVYDPAARYFGKSTRRRRTVPAGARRPEAGSASMRWAALFLALLPVAVGIGVVVGKGGGNDDKLIEALRSQRGTVAAATGGSQARTAAVAAATTGALTSDFPLQKGYAVKLSTLPVQGTDRAAATKAEAAAKARGANQVGLINPKEFTTKPDQGSGSYVIYSGSFKDRAGATRLLAKLKRKFPGAVVIAVASANGGGSSGKALSRTSLGTAHQVAGFRPSAQKVKQDTQLVQRINRQTGRTYVQSQRNLPDQIVVGGTPGSAPAPPQGSGQP